MNKVAESNTPLDRMFIEVKSENRAALIGYVPAGFPSPDSCIEVIKAMVAGGIDAIEIGFPYSDPVMDGPIIQAAADQSLKSGTTAVTVFETLKIVATMGIPAVVMTYWNPIEKYGISKFAQDISASGGSGVITPDLTFEESAEWKAAAKDSNINSIYVVAPSTTDARLPKVTQQCSGFVYAASLMGVTGTRSAVSSSARELVRRIRLTTATPIAVGLGVSTREQANEVATYADGVIVGSAFINLIQAAENFEIGLKQVEELAHQLSLGVRNA
jgi:tryptophan synthase alpha chain